MPRFRRFLRHARIAGLLLPAALLASGCASNSARPAPDAYCLNTRGAALAPGSMLAVNCTNLPDSALSRSALPPPAKVADNAPLKLAPVVDLDRYAGRWYVIANIPYVLEKGNVGAYVEYHFKDGKVQDLYFAHPKTFSTPLSKSEGHGYVVDGTHNARWRVTFLWPFYVTYPILYVSSDYQVALVGYPDRSLGWVFSRKPHMSNTELKVLLKRFAAQGYDVSQFRRVPQTPAQLQGQY